ncbi:MAG: DUF1822 family protein [Elainellaceae cyanobacterium]
MITSSSDSLTMTVPISLAAHQRAQRLCRRQRDRQKAQQIYLNTLAVSAVDLYLRCMAVQTNLDTSQSADPVLVTALDTAALEIVNQGLLECRPVLPNQPSVYIPPEVWSDRLGYVAVQLDDSLSTATLLGFVKTVNTQNIPLDQLRPLDELLEHLQQSQPAQVVESRTHLSRWLENLVDDGWRSLESLLGAHQTQLAFGFRSHAPLNDTMVKRAKLLDLGLQLNHQSLALLVAITPHAQTPSSDVQDMLDILVQLHPSHGETHLPSDVHISLHSESGDVLQDVRSRQYDNYIQLKRFRGTPGECFDIQVSLGQTNIIETFVI